MTDNTKLNELTPGEHETEAAMYSMRSSSPNWGDDYGDYNEPENNFPDSGSTSDDIEMDNGGYTPPDTTEPNVESTEDDGVFPNPSNPGTNVGSNTSDGVHTDPDRPSPGSGSSSCPPTDNDGGEHSHPPSTDPEIGSTTKDDGVHTDPDRPSTGSGSSSSCPPTDDNGGEHSHPSTTDPDIGSTTEDDGVQKDPTNPGTDVDSSTSDGDNQNNNNDDDDEEGKQPDITPPFDITTTTTTSNKPTSASKYGIFFALPVFIEKLGWKGYLRYKVNLPNTVSKRLYWESSDSDVVTIGRHSGYITTRGVGETIITVSTDDNIYSATCVIKVIGSDLFSTLMSKNVLQKDEIEHTDDGFSILTKSVGSLLMDSGVDSLAWADEENSIAKCHLYFDDWYIYSLEVDNSYKYGLIKMREQEYDGDEEPADNDDPGVTISFVEFDTTQLMNCIDDPAIENRISLYNEIDRVVRQENQKHDDDIYNYFSVVKAEASYLVAEIYVKYVASFAQNGYIMAPANYIAIREKYDMITNDIEDIRERIRIVQTMLPLNHLLLDSLYAELQIYRNKQKDLERIPSAINNINSNSDYDIYDIKTDRIYVKNPRSLTYDEKCVILMTHTANVTFNSFAAEVKYHAYALEEWYGKLNLLGAYESAIRADMAIGEENESGITDAYYNLDSQLVKEQIECHGEY